MRKVFVIVFLMKISFAWWSPPMNLGITGADDINPQTCRKQLVQSPYTCLVWQTNLNGNWDIFSRFSDLTTWRDTLRITAVVAADINPSVAYDSARDCIWCVWQNNNAGNWDIYVSQGNISSGWLTPFQLTVDVVDDELPSVYVNNDTVWVIWQITRNILSAYYDGTIWSTPIPITNDSVFSNTNPKINGRYDHPFVVWGRDDGDIYYSEYLSASWLTPQPITTDPANDINPDLCTFDDWGSIEGVHVVWQSDRDGNYEIYTTAYDTLNVHYRMTNNGSADITPSPLYFIAVTRQEGPPLTAFSTNRNGNYDIYANWYWSPFSDPVDTAGSEDILPTTTGVGFYIWLLWQTDRNTDWDIYGRYMYVGGIEESYTYDFKSRDALIVTPNPFRNKTDIRWQMEDERLKTEDISLKIYDASGKLVRNFSLPTTVFWDGTDNSGLRLPEGVYFVRLENESEALTEKVVLIK